MTYIKKSQRKTYGIKLKINLLSIVTRWNNINSLTSINMDIKSCSLHSRFSYIFYEERLMLGHI